MADAVETGQFRYHSTVPKVRRTGAVEGNEANQGLPTTDLFPYVTRLRGISDAFSLSEDILLNGTGYWARLLDALNVSGALQAGQSQYDVRLDTVIDHFKTATRNTVGRSGMELHVLSDKYGRT